MRRVVGLFYVTVTWLLQTLSETRDVHTSFFMRDLTVGWVLGFLGMSLNQVSGVSWQFLERQSIFF